MLTRVRARTWRCPTGVTHCRRDRQRLSAARVNGGVCVSTRLVQKTGPRPHTLRRFRAANLRYLGIYYFNNHRLFADIGHNHLGRRLPYWDSLYGIRCYEGYVWPDTYRHYLGRIQSFDRFGNSAKVWRGSSSHHCAYRDHRTLPEARPPGLRGNERRNAAGTWWSCAFTGWLVLADLGSRSAEARLQSDRRLNEAWP
jgi:hypothetical protein